MPFEKVDIAKKIKDKMKNNPEFKKEYLKAREEYKLTKEGECRYGIHSPSTLKLISCNGCEQFKGHCIIDDIGEEV